MYGKHSAKNQFLYRGYTFQQEMDWKARREELRKELEGDPVVQKL